MFEPLEAEILFSHYAQSFASSSLDSFFAVITHLGNPLLWLLIGAFLYWKGDERKSFFLTLTILFAAATVGLLKLATGRLRPSGTEFRVLAYEPDSPYAFPSGHATTITGVFGYYWEKFRRNARIIGLLAVLLVMVSRVYLGAHYIGDVIVGALFGFLIGRIVHFLMQKYDKVKVSQKLVFEEAGLVATILLALVVSIALRELALASIFLGYFAGVFAFKLLGFDSRKLAGRELWAKQLFGFLGIGAIWLLSQNTAFAPEAYFLGGAWVTLLYPWAYEKIAKKKPAK